MMSTDTLYQAGGPPRRILSIDVDDLVIANADFFDESPGSNHVPQVEHDVATALGVLGECGVQATFFVNAQYCERYPTIVPSIHARGHAIASHGFRHQNIANLTLEEFEADLRKSLELLSRGSAEIVGYRPPAFSMPYDDAHLQVLRRNGIRYVSSGIGVARSNAPRSEHPVEIPHGLLHVPISTLQLLGGRIKYAIGYGVTSRLMPESLYRLSLREWLRRKDYFHWYCHSFELSGLPDSFEIPYRKLGARLSTAIYAWKCRNRREYLKSILESAPFLSIESSLFGNRSRP